MINHKKQLNNQINQNCNPIIKFPYKMSTPQQNLLSPLPLPSQTLQQILNETPTHPKIKQTLKLLTLTRQKITYHSLVSSPQTYLQLRGLANHDQQQFNYINKIMHSKIAGVLGKIKRKQLQVRDFMEQLKQMQQQRIKQENMINYQLVAQVQHVINNIDLPLSLFKRNDKYWYQDNPKTIQAKNYVHQRIKQQRQRKKKLREQNKKKQQQRQKQQKTRMEKQMKQEQERRKKFRQSVAHKIQQLKKNTQQRQKSITQSQKYTASLKPLYAKLQQQQDQSHYSALQEQKKRLNQLRKLHKSIDFTQIQQHKKKLLQIQKQKQVRKIFDQPLKVSYKSKYHTSMTARSRVSQQYQTTKSLYEKKKQYGNLIKTQFKPHLDQHLVEQMEQRLKLMRRKRVRKNPKKKEQKKKNLDDSDQDDENQQQQQNQPQKKQPEIKKQPQKNKNSDSDQDDQDQQERPPPRIRGQDEDPDRKQRYQLGVGYLEYAKKKKKLKKQGQNNQQQFGQTSQVSQAQGQMQNTSGASQRYKDYLKQFVKTNRSTIDHIDTTRMKDQYNKSIIGNNQDFVHLSQLQNQTKKVQDKINREQQLLRYRKLKNQQAVAKKVEIDNAVIDTIKARLALMGK